jgi:hypothetical protein
VPKPIAPSSRMEIDVAGEKTIAAISDFAARPRLSGTWLTR